MQVTEQNKLYQLKSGDIHAFEIMYADMHPRLYAFCRKFINNSESAKDIVQDLFFDFWSIRTELDINISVSAYLFKMLHNRCLNYIRDQKIHQRHLDLIETKFKETELNYFDADQKNHVSIYFKEIQEIFNKSIQELPEGCREIFLLSRIEGLNYKTIAEKLNLSIRTVENQNYRAMKILKVKLKDYLPVFLLFISNN